MDIWSERVEAGGHCYGRMIASLDEGTSLTLGSLSRRKGLQSDRPCKRAYAVRAGRTGCSWPLETGWGRCVPRKSLSRYPFVDLSGAWKYSIASQLCKKDSFQIEKMVILSKVTIILTHLCSYPLFYGSECEIFLILSPQFDIPTGRKAKVDKNVGIQPASKSRNVFTYTNLTFVSVLQ